MAPEISITSTCTGRTWDPEATLTLLLACEDHCSSDGKLHGRWRRMAPGLLRHRLPGDLLMATLPELYDSLYNQRYTCTHDWQAISRCQHLGLPYGPTPYVTVQCRMCGKTKELDLQKKEDWR